MTSSTRKRLLCFCVVFVLSLVSADDVTTDAPRSRNTTSVRRSIHPHAMTIRSDVMHRYATTTVTQKFTNDQQTGNNMVAVFRFLIPKSAVVTNFTASVDGRQFQAERQQQQPRDAVVVAGGVNADKVAAAAAAAAEAIRGRDGIGMETIRGRSTVKTISQIRHAARQFTDRSVFQAEVELPPGGKVDFHLSFEELLVRRLGVYDLSFILGQSQGHGPIRDLRVDVRVKETSDVSFLRVFPPPGQLDSSMTSLPNGTEEGHQQLRIRRTSSGAAHVTYTPTVADQSQWIAAMTSPDDVSMFSVRYDVRHQLDAGEIQIKDSHFVHHFSPSGLQTIDKNIVFIIDCSSSSGGGGGGGESTSKMSDIRTALINILDELRPPDMFNVIAYSSILRYWNTDSVVPASPANIGSAKTFVAGLQRVSSGSNINDALLRAVDFLIKQEESDPLATRVSSFLLVADSSPSTGIIEPDRILANVRQAAGGRVSAFAFGLRSDVGRPFLDRLGQQNRGAARRCSGGCSGRTLVEQIRSFYRELASPLLENVRVRYDEAVDESSLTDVDFPAYMDGSELVIAGRLSDRNTQGSSGSGGQMSAKVSGGSAQGYMSLDTKLKTPRSDRTGHRRSRGHSTNGNVVERIWAWLTTQRLLRKAHDTNNDTIRDVTLASIQQLATQYSFATSMTSLVLRDVIRPNSTIHVAFYNSDDELLKTATAEEILMSRRRPLLINSKQRDQSDSRRSFVDNDPHFLVAVNGLSKAVCFDVDGHPGTVYQLLHDHVTNVSVNALVIAARGRQQDSSAHHHPAKTRTYLGKIAVLAGPSCTVIMDPHNVYIDLQAFPWTHNASLPCINGGTTSAVHVDITSGHHVTIAMGTDIVVRVLRHVVGPSHPFKVDFLGFYIERSDGLSQDTHGLIGQFINQRAQQVRSTLRFHDNDDNDSLRLVSKLTFIGPHTPRRTVRAVLAERRDMEVKRSIPCWHVARNGNGLIQGTPENYAVPHLLARKSSFETVQTRD